MHRMIRIATVTAASLALVIASTGPAFAASATVEDKRSDVVLNGSVSGERTSKQQGIAIGTDARSATFTLGDKYISARVHMTTVRQDVTYVLDMDVSGRGEKPGVGRGYSRLHVVLGQGGSSTTYDPSGAVVCGQAVPRSPKITAGLKLGGRGNIYVQVPRRCLGADPSTKKIERKAKFTVSSPGRTADQSTSTDGYTDFVSSTKFKTSKWTAYVKN